MERQRKIQPAEVTVAIQVIARVESRTLQSLAKLAYVRDGDPAVTVEICACPRRDRRFVRSLIDDDDAVAVAIRNSRRACDVQRKDGRLRIARIDRRRSFP